MRMEHYLLRVGADTKSGGFRSHLSKDRSYKFIPIPEEPDMLIGDKALRYSDFKWEGDSIVPYLPHGISPHQTIHNDPEFATYTYGSPKYTRYGAGPMEKNYTTLSEMRNGDILTFYAAFSSSDTTMDGLYFFAYFVVDCVVHWAFPEDLNEDKRVLVRNNHHFIHQQKDQVVVVGGTGSRVFKKAALLSSAGKDRRRTNYYPCASVQQCAKYEKAMNLSSLRKLSSDVAFSFKDYLDSHSA